MPEAKVSYEFLIKIKEYIEEATEICDSKLGLERNLNELILDDDMPKIYYEVCKLIEGLNTNKMS